MNNSLAMKQSKGYRVFAFVILFLLAVFFMFPLYWIITGSFKTAAAINAQRPQWFPLEPTLMNYTNSSASPPSSGCSIR